jgi:hypothetical protein
MTDQTVDTAPVETTDAPTTEETQVATPVVAEPTAVVADPAAKPEVKSDWPDNWREKYSTDPKVLKRLERYASPKAALDALFAAQTKISSGELKTALKPDSTPEEKAAWRVDNGIPATPAEYDIALPDGRVVGEADKAIVDEFLKTAHESNLHPSQVKDALGWYFTKQDQEVAARDARDVESKMKSEDVLRAEFGQDYRKNVTLAKQLLDSAPDGVGEQIMGGRLPDGTPIGNSPEVIRWLVGLSRELNPIGTVVPGSGTNAVQAVESEMAALRSKMGDRTSDYWKGPTAARNQERYRELTSALSKGR